MAKQNQVKPDKQNILLEQSIPLLIFESLAPVSCDRQLLLPSEEYGTKYMLPNSSPLLRIHPANSVGVRQSVPSSAIYDCTSFVIFEDPPIEDPLLLLLPTDNCDRDWKIDILPIINQNHYHHKYIVFIIESYIKSIQLKITLVLDHCKEEECCFESGGED